MRLRDLYPAHFEPNRKSFNALMRAILIQGTYDSLLKKMTGYKGMCLDESNGECWTIKFDQFQGVFGLILVDIQGAMGEFCLYYFPSVKETLFDKFSLAEGWVAGQEDFISKVRTFGAHQELLTQFRVASLSLHVNLEKESLGLLYESQLRERVYSKEGVLNPQTSSYVVTPGGIDKDVPTFRLLLPFMHFLNTAITRITNSSPEYFRVFKAKGQCVAYDGIGVFHEVLSATNVRLLIALGYGSEDYAYTFDPIIKKNKAVNISSQMSLTRFLEKAPWYDINESEHFVHSEVNGALNKPKLMVITGFLGSGKTNLLQNYIEYETEKNRFVGIIQNEIGKTGLDGRLSGYDYSQVEMDEGCVCCSLSGQIRSGITQLMEKAKPDTILLETTGVANPFNLLSELGELEDMIDLEAIVTVVDVRSAKELYGKYRVFQDQIRAADIILLNKVDGVDEASIQDVTNLLVENNRCAAIIPTVKCDIHPNLLQASSTSSTAQIASMIIEDEMELSTHVQDNISSIKIDIAHTLQKEEFKEYLEALPPNVFRVKGIVEFQGEENQWIVQYVNGQYELLEQESSQKNQTFLVYIGTHMKEQYLENPAYM